MKVIAIIPARYNSSRFKGKPLVDILGKPMIVRVCEQVKKAKKIDDVYVATDDERIFNECKKNDINTIMTGECGTSTERLYKVSKKVDADYYVCINGDEPLISPTVIDKIVPSKISKERYYVSNLITKIKSPSEVIDFTNIKVVKDTNNNALLYSRSPIPYPKSSLDYNYYKHLGVLCYNKNALEFFATTDKGEIEKIEDVNELRFLEHGIKVKLIPVNTETLSVDTPKDLDKVIEILKKGKSKK